MPKVTCGHPTATSHSAWIYHQECDWRRPLWICCRLIGLGHLGIDTTHQELRQNVCSFLRQNPYTADGVHYKHFLTSSDADAEWETFLEDLSRNEWVDEVVMQALADMLSVNIDVLTTIRADVRPVSHYTCRGQPVGTITVGLIAAANY